MKSISKKKLQQKNKELADKVLAKDSGKADLHRQLKEAKEDAAYWEDMHARAIERVTGNLFTLAPSARTSHAWTSHIYTELSQHPAPWMQEMLKVGTSSNGKRIVKPYPAELILMSMKLMANGVPSSQVNDNITTVLDGTEKLDKTMYNWPDETTHRQWRYGMKHVCEVQIGMELTS